MHIDCRKFASEASSFRVIEDPLWTRPGSLNLGGNIGGGACSGYAHPTFNWKMVMVIIMRMLDNLNSHYSTYVSVQPEAYLQLSETSIVIYSCMYLNH